ncbi:MAG TPA: hypothetical protein VFM71_01485, partial [Gemmatimonadaceae bacterium]|nr:hypothetical protein [Gemmatimonadaceae bacterium]
MTRAAVYTTLLALVLAGIWAIGRASDIAGANRARTEMLEENAVTVALAFKQRRDSVMAATDAQKDVVAEASATTDRAAERLTVTLADARAALADSAATMETLRIQLANTVFAADTLLATL